MTHTTRKTDMAYLAGFFDGEGSVMLSVNPSGGLKIAIACSQNTRTVLEMYQRAFDGHVYEQPIKGRASSIFQWRCNGAEAIAALTLMEPWLLVKLYAAQEAQNAWHRKQKGDDTWLDIVEAHKTRVQKERKLRRLLLSEKHSTQELGR